MAELNAEEHAAAVMRAMERDYRTRIETLTAELTTTRTERDEAVAVVHDALRLADALQSAAIGAEPAAEVRCTNPLRERIANMASATQMYRQLVHAERDTGDLWAAHFARAREIGLEACRLLERVGWPYSGFGEQLRAHLSTLGKPASEQSREALTCPSCLWRGLDSATWARAYGRCPECGFACRRESEVTPVERESYARREIAKAGKPASERDAEEVRLMREVCTWAAYHRDNWWRPNGGWNECATALDALRRHRERTHESAGER